MGHILKIELHKFEETNYLFVVKIEETIPFYDETQPLFTFAALDFGLAVCYVDREVTNIVKPCTGSWVV